MDPVLIAKSVSKKYGTVVALDNADLELYPGEVLGVIGDNGAGKSTLIKVLCGAPHRTLMRVDLPAPLSPITPSTSPG